jgi:phosphatidate cytidylyltransferase
MVNVLKKRVATSLVLLTSLFAMLINNYILVYFLIVLGLFSLLEFFKIISIIQKKDKLKQLFFNILFIIYIFLFCSLFVILSSLIHIKILIFVILITCIASDIGGFAFGKIFKGPKLTKISPKKTISGSLGSFIISASVISLLMFYLTNHLDLKIFIIGLVTSFACQLGDLFFSFLKRKSFMKDTGNILPGHGGILDRIDGIIFGIPVGFLSLLLIF